jgi:hypothetical protein
VIVASLVLILAAAVLLVVGLVRDSDVLLVVSIALSLVAAVALYLGARQPGGPRTAADGPDEDGDGAAEPAESTGAGFRSTALRQERPDWPLPPGSAGGATAGEPLTAARAAEPATTELATAEHATGERATTEWLGAEPLSTGRTVAGPGTAGPSTAADDLPPEPDEDPSDEPPAQHTPREDAALIARLPAEVLVVDGRPRYHVPACRHLAEREYEPLPVAEAVELGFTPCGWCQPDTVLLGGTPRD